MHSRSHARQAARRGEEKILLKWYPMEVCRDINVESVNNSVSLFALKSYALSPTSGCFSCDRTTNLLASVRLYSYPMMDACPSISPGRCTLLYVQSNSYGVRSLLQPFILPPCGRHYVSYMGRNISLFISSLPDHTNLALFPTLYVYGHTVSDWHRHRIIPVSVDPNCMKN